MNKLKLWDGTIVTFSKDISSMQEKIDSLTTVSKLLGWKITPLTTWNEDRIGFGFFKQSKVNNGYTQCYEITFHFVGGVLMDIVFIYEDGSYKKFNNDELDSIENEIEVITLLL